LALGAFWGEKNLGEPREWDEIRHSLDLRRALSGSVGVALE